MQRNAVFYDGQTAHRHLVAVEPLANSIAIRFEEGRRVTVPLGELRRQDEGAGGVRVEREGHEGWRLILPAPISPSIERLIPTATKYGKWIDRTGFVPALVVLAFIAAAAIAVLYLAPSWVAPLVPQQWEKNVGDAMVGDFGKRRCRSDEAEAALDALVLRLAGREQAANVDPAILDIGIENAAALPGGNIVLFEGALEGWENPDAVAGVVAHEIAHVSEHHVTEALVRELGLGAILRLLADDMGVQTQALVALSYTRGNEEEADARAIDMMLNAGIDLDPVADLFDRFAEFEGDEQFLGGFLDTHPVSAERAARFRAAAERQGDVTPAFTTAQWKAIREACG